MLTAESIQFLNDLRSNNNRDWFQSQKVRYETYKKDYQQLVANFLDAMKPLDPSLEKLEVKDCIFRINRDIRFSKDKSPYKTNLGIWMSSGAKHSEAAGYYLHIDPQGSFFGGGLYMPTPEQLLKIRKEINFFHDDLEKILNEKTFKSTYGGFSKHDNNMLKNPPRGFDKEHPAIEYLKMKSFVATQKFDVQDVLKPDFVLNMSQKLIALKPLNDFLNRGLNESE